MAQTVHAGIGKLDNAYSMTPPSLSRIDGNPFGVSLFPTDPGVAPVNAPEPGTTSALRTEEDSYDSDRLGISFSSRLIADPAGGATIPPGPALSLADARALSDARLSAMSPDERADAVTSVCRSIAPLRASIANRATSVEARSVAERDLHALIQQAIRMLRSTLDDQSLEATFERMISTRELGFVVDQIGLTELIALCNYGTYGLDFNAIAARSDTVRERGMTQREREYTARIFGTGIDYDAVRFRFTTGVMTSGAEALVLGNTVHVDPSTTRFTFRPGTTEPDDAGLFNWSTTVLAHELTHVWQYQHIGSSYALRSLSQQVESIIRTGDRNGPYRYELSEHRNFSEFGIEQQAMIVEDYDTLLRRVEAGELPRTALRQYQPFIDQLRAAGPGSAQPMLSPEQLAQLPPDSPFRNLSGADGVTQGVAAMFPGLARRIGSEAFADMLHGSATGALLVAAVAALSYQRGSVVLEEFGVPNTIRLGTGRAGLSLGVRYDARFTNAAGVVGFDARGRLGSALINGDVQATINARGIERATARLSARTDDLSLDVGARYDRTGVFAGYRLFTRRFWSDGNITWSPALSLQNFALRAGYRDSHFSASAAAVGDTQGLQDLRLSASANVGPASVFGNVHLGRDGVFTDASVAGALSLRRDLDLDGAAAFGTEGLRSVRGGIIYRPGEDSSLRLNIGYMPSSDERSLDFLATSGTFSGFARAVTGPQGDSLTLGLSGRF